MGKRRERDIERLGGNRAEHRERLRAVWIKRVLGKRVRFWEGNVKSCGR